MSLNPEEAAQRTRDAIKRGGFKDYAPQENPLRDRLTPEEGSSRSRTLTSAELKTRLTQKAYEQSVESGQEIRGAAEDPGQKLRRIEKGERR